jgi:prepilin-type processing-associated H-X9-DG protein
MMRNINVTRCAPRGLARREVIVVIAIIVVFALILQSSRAHEKSAVKRAKCVRHLEHIGRSFNLWAGDHDHLYPMSFYLPTPGETNSPDDTTPLRCFQVMSNELGFASILDCPADGRRQYATNFTTDLDRTRISYFIGLDANSVAPKSFLAGDRNISTGMPANNGILNITAKQSVTWSGDLHNGWGNVVLADGSVQGMKSRELNGALLQTGLATNRLFIP